MKTKVCARCNKRKKIKSFRENNIIKSGYHSYCLTCESEYQKTKREKASKRRLISHDDVIMENKSCSLCGEIKHKTEFLLEKKVKSGLTSRCLECLRKEASTYKRNNPDKAYHLTHPDEWKNYYKEYKRNYTTDPFNSKRQTLASMLCKLINNKLVKKPKKGTCCSDCGAKCKTQPKAYFTDKYIKSIFRERPINKERMIANINWLCNDCIYNKRKR